MAAQEREEGPEPTPPGDGEPARPAGPPEPPEPSDTVEVPPPPVGPSGTSILPPTPGGPPPEEPPRWAARAQVPTPRIEEAPDEWVTEPPRGVLVPVLITVCVMLLLGVLGFGVWLLVANQPEPTPPATPTSTSAPVTTTTRSTPPPTTTAASPTPTTVQVPPLIDETYEDAAERLEDLGLTPKREDIFSASVPEGRVIGTNPTAGTPVALGDTITVFVSKGPEPTETPTDTPTGTSTPTDEDAD